MKLKFILIILLILLIFVVFFEVWTSGSGMGKWGKYTRKYKLEWEKLPVFKNWLQKSDNDGVCCKEAFCQFCKVYLRAHKGDLIRHANSQTYTQNEDLLDPKVQPKLNINEYRLDPNDEIKQADIQLALYIASHNSINSIDHLGDVLKSLGKGSTLENLRIKRTKCAALIKKVIAPCFLEELVKDIGDQPYSIIIDESTDISNEKLMAYCVRYYSLSTNKMITGFLGFQSVERATAEQLHENFLEFLKQVKLNINRLLAIATDGASNLCGRNNSLYTKLKESNSNLIQLKCVCHSLHLCAQKASEELPSSVEQGFENNEEVKIAVLSWLSASGQKNFCTTESRSSLKDGKSALN